MLEEEKENKIREIIKKSKKREYNRTSYETNYNSAFSLMLAYYKVLDKIQETAQHIKEDMKESERFVKVINEGKIICEGNFERSEEIIEAIRKIKEKSSKIKELLKINGIVDSKIEDIDKKIEEIKKDIDYIREFKIEESRGIIEVKNKIFEWNNNEWNIETDEDGVKKIIKVKIFGIWFNRNVAKYINVRIREEEEKKGSSNNKKMLEKVARSVVVASTEVMRDTYAVWIIEGENKEEDKEEEEEVKELEMYTVERRIEEEDVLYYVVISIFSNWVLIMNGIFNLFWNYKLAAYVFFEAYCLYASLAGIIVLGSNMKTKNKKYSVDSEENRMELLILLKNTIYTCGIIFQKHTGIVTNIKELIEVIEIKRIEEKNRKKDKKQKSKKQIEIIIEIIKERTKEWRKSYKIRMEEFFIGKVKLLKRNVFRKDGLYKRIEGINEAEKLLFKQKRGEDKRVVVTSFGNFVAKLKANNVKIKNNKEKMHLIKEFRKEVKRGIEELYKVEILSKMLEKISKEEYKEEIKRIKGRISKSEEKIEDMSKKIEEFIGEEKEEEEKRKKEEEEEIEEKNRENIILKKRKKKSEKGREKKRVRIEVMKERKLFKEIKDAMMEEKEEIEEEEEEEEKEITEKEIEEILKEAEEKEKEEEREKEREKERVYIRAIVEKYRKEKEEEKEGVDFKIEEKESKRVEEIKRMEKIEYKEKELINSKKNLEMVKNRELLKKIEEINKESADSEKAQEVHMFGITKNENEKLNEFMKKEVEVKEDKEKVNRIREEKKNRVEENRRIIEEDYGYEIDRKVEEMIYWYWERWSRINELYVDRMLKEEVDEKFMEEIVYYIEYVKEEVEQTYLSIIEVIKKEEDKKREEELAEKTKEEVEMEELRNIQREMVLKECEEIKMEEEEVKEVKDLEDVMLSYIYKMCRDFKGFDNVKKLKEIEERSIVSYYGRGRYDEKISGIIERQENLYSQHKVVLKFFVKEFIKKHGKIEVKEKTREEDRRAMEIRIKTKLYVKAYCIIKDGKSKIMEEAKKEVEGFYEQNKVKLGEIRAYMLGEKIKELCGKAVQLTKLEEREKLVSEGMEEVIEIITKMDRIFGKNFYDII